MMASYHKNPCKRVVLALFSEHLSASENHNTLIYSIFKSNADSDRCFSTFIFFVMCQYNGRILCLYSTSNVFINAIHKELQAAVSSKAYTNLRQPMVKVVYFLIIRGGILLSQNIQRLPGHAATKNYRGIVIRNEKKTCSLTIYVDYLSSYL